MLYIIEKLNVFLLRECSHLEVILWEFAINREQSKTYQNYPQPITTARLTNLKKVKLQIDSTVRHEMTHYL